MFSYKIPHCEDAITLHCFSSVIFNKPIYLFVCIPSLRWKWLTPFLLLKPLYSSKVFCSHVCVCPCVGVCTCDGYTHTHSHTFYENPVSSGLKHIHISCSVNRPLYFIMHFFSSFAFAWLCVYNVYSCAQLSNFRENYSPFYYWKKSIFFHLFIVEFSTRVLGWVVYLCIS